MDEKKLILKVQKNKANNQKFINIPKNQNLQEDDYVLVKKVVDNNKNGKS